MNQNSTKKSPRNITMHYSLVQAFYWMGFACVSAFSSVYMLSLNISNSVIGLTLSIGALCSALMQPLVGMLIDNSEKITNKNVLIFTSGSIVVCGLLLFPVSKGAPVIVPIIYGLAMLMLQLAQPFTNSLGMTSLNAGYKLNFGPARAIGSLGYAAVALILGKVAAIYGGTIVPLFIVLAFAFGIISLLFYPLKEKSNSLSTNENSGTNENSSQTSELIKNASNDKPSLIDFFKKYPSLGIMILGLVFIFFSHVVLNSFGLQIVTSKGGSSESLGVSTAISASIEILPMIFFPFLVKKFKITALLKVSAIFFTLKVVFTLIAPNVAAYYAAQICQILGFGIMAVAIVYYVNEAVSMHDTAQGQAYAGMALTIGNVIGNMIGGKVIDDFGINTLLGVGIAAAVTGSVIFFIGINKSKSHAI